jgi:hypothetical protein
LVVFGAALMSGFATVLTKIADTFIQTGHFKEHPFLTGFMVLLIPPLTVNQVHLLNMSFKFYDQMEIMPFYQTLLSIVWILTGMYLLQEVENYKGVQLFGVFLGICISCMGMFLLTKKPVSVPKPAVTELYDMVHTNKN